MRHFALGSWKEAHTHLVKTMGCLGVGTFWSSCHQARVSTWWAHHLTHWWGLSKDSSGIRFDLTCPHHHQVTLFQIGIPVQMSPALSSVLSPWAPLPRTRAKSQEPATSRLCLSGVVGWEVCFTSVSLESSKVTHLLGLNRLGKATHLLAGSSGWPAGEGVCPLWPLLCLLLLDCWWLANCPQLLCCPQDRVAQLLYVSL